MGCQVDPLADIGEFSNSVTTGHPYLHRVLQRDGTGSVLHIYLEGDGRPWLSGARVSTDPTPHQPLMLTLAKLDDAPVAYIGRPCYFQVSDPRCHPGLWTAGRYSEAVVASVDAVVNRLAAPYDGIVLIGHSGGGTLAVLIASRHDDVEAVVTIGANLNPVRWARTHGYSELTDSLNPTDLDPLPDDIAQHHYLGDQDRAVTADLQTPYFDNQPAARFHIVRGFDHQCCWSSIWQRVLSDVAGSTAPGDSRK